MGETMNGSEELRIVLLGKTGAGKSSAGNVILGQQYFKESSSATSGTFDCERKEMERKHWKNGKKTVVIDTPGIFDTGRSEKDLKYALVSCLTECAPGPHVFVVVIKVDRYTKEEKAALAKITKWFGKKVLKHTVVLFTHGDKLEAGKSIQDHINGDDDLQNFYKSCGNRAHVIDCKYWIRKDEEKDKERFATLLKAMQSMRQSTDQSTDKTLTEMEAFIQELQKQNLSSYSGATAGQEQDKKKDRNNASQVSQLFETIDDVVTQNSGTHYTNEILSKLAEAIDCEVQNIMKEENTEEETPEIRKRARDRVKNKTSKLVAGVSVGVLLGALLGVVVGVSVPAILIGGLLTAGGIRVAREMKQCFSEKQLACVGVAANIAAAGAAVGAGAGEAGAAVGAGAAIGAGAVDAGAAVGAGAAIGAGAAEGGAAAGAAGAALGAGAIAGIAAGAAAGVLATAGAVRGGVVGAKAARRSDTSNQAAKKAAGSVAQEGKNTMRKVWDLTQRIAESKHTNIEYEELWNDD